MRALERGDALTASLYGARSPGSPTPTNSARREHISPTAANAARARLNSHLHDLGGAVAVPGAIEGLDGQLVVATDRRSWRTRADEGVGAVRARGTPAPTRLCPASPPPAGRAGVAPAGSVFASQASAAGRQWHHGRQQVPSSAAQRGDQPRAGAQRQRPSGTERAAELASPLIDQAVLSADRCTRAALRPTTAPGRARPRRRAGGNCSAWPGVTHHQSRSRRPWSPDYAFGAESARHAQPSRRPRLHPRHPPVGQTRGGGAPDGGDFCFRSQ